MLGQSELGKLRKATLIFLIAEALDYLTTWIGLSMGAREINAAGPVEGLIWIKLVLILMVAYSIQGHYHIKKRIWWADFAIVSVPVLTVIWNMLNLIPLPA